MGVCSKLKPDPDDSTEISVLRQPSAKIIPEMGTPGVTSRMNKHALVPTGGAKTGSLEYRITTSVSALDFLSGMVRTLFSRNVFSELLVLKETTGKTSRNYIIIWTPLPLIHT
jgi:hypothetical protein